MSKLGDWFETFQSDPFTVAIVGALVDCAESLQGIIDTSPFAPEDMPPHGQKAVEALSELEDALNDVEAAT